MMHKKSVHDLSCDLQSKAISSVELTQYFLGRSESQSDLNAYITLCPETALSQAKQADEQLAKGEAHPLCGIPLAHKDLFCTESVKTSCGSKFLDNFVPPYDATVVAKCKELGMPLLGKANCDEFAMGSSNENSYYGVVKNPWDKQRVPGGSSGGSAAIVAAGLAPLATGTDTGGSIRQPAAFCGITGLKPTYGSVSRYGMVAYASSFDQGGPMGRSAQDCAYLFDAIKGFDHRDSTSVERENVLAVSALSDTVKGVKIGIPRALLEKGLSEAVAQSVLENIKVFESLGAEIIDIELPSIDLSLPAYYVLAPSEASSNLSRYDGVRYGRRCEAPKDLQDLYVRSRTEALGSEVKRRIMVGTYALSAGYYDAYYLKAQKLRRMVAEDFKSVFEQVDVIYMPTTPDVAFPIGSLNEDPAKMYLQDIFTIPVNLAGLPSIGFPVGQHEGLPIGNQLIGSYFTDNQLLNLAHQFQQVTDWHLQRPEESK